MRTFLVSSLLLSTTLLAQDYGAQTPAAAEKVVSGAMGLDITTAYFFRGILQENQGIIAQPWLQLGYSLWEDSESPLRSLDLSFGLWNSLHDGPSGGAGGPWYESDFYIDLSAHLEERFTLGSTFTAYHSPNGLFNTVQELAFSLGYDDRGVLIEGLDSGLQPSFLIAFETSGQADAGDHRGTYFQASIEPTFAIGNLGDAPLKLATPVTLGTSLHNYYEHIGVGGNDNFFGFLDIAADVSAPMNFLPARMGPWDAHVGLHLLFLGDNNEQLNPGDTTALVLAFGISTTF